MEEVESDHGLGDEAIPFLGGKVRVARSKSGAKVIFECVDCMLCCVAEVGVRVTSCKSTLYLRKGFLHGVVVLVVKDVESGVCTILA